MRVELKTRPISGGRLGLYLDYTLPSGRYRSSLGLYVAAKPKNAIERDDREHTMRLGERRRSEEYLRCLDGYVPSRMSAVTVSEFCRELKLERANTRTQNGWETVARHLDRSGIGSIRLARLTAADCLRFRSYIMSINVKKSTAGHMFGIFRTALHQGHHRGLMKDDLREKCDAIRGEKAVIEHLTQSELDTLLATPYRHDDTRRAFALSCMTGLRFSDIERLTWSEVYDLPDGWELRIEVRKTGRPLTIPITADTRAWMGDRGTGRVFRRLRKSTMVNRHLETWRKNAGLMKHLHFHMARHTYATLALAAGVDLKTVSDLLGHSSIAMTEIYARVIDETRRSAAGAVHTSAPVDVSPGLRLVR